MDMRLEVVMLAVSDVDRAKDFYKKLGFREDIDLNAGPVRLVQFTPPGSSASVFIGTGITPAEPGSIKGLVLVVDDIETAYKDLVDRGVKAEPVFHGPTGLFYHTGVKNLEPGPDPEHKSYSSFTAFSDPDGNGWIVQEIKDRLPGR